MSASDTIKGYMEAMLAAEEDCLYAAVKISNLKRDLTKAETAMIEAKERAREARELLRIVQSREVREEVNLELDSLEFLCTCANRYVYGGVTYPVLDVFYTARPRAGASAAALEDVESFCWLKPQEVPLDEIAFLSVKTALGCWLRRAGLDARHGA